MCSSDLPLDGIRALDLFAGTGSISIELVSRGCDQVISVEKVHVVGEHIEQILFGKVCGGACLEGVGHV